jgi:hypothetical protein
MAPRSPHVTRKRVEQPKEPFMRKSLTLTCAAMLIALPSFAFAQSGAGGAGVGNSDSSAGVPSNVHSSPAAPADSMSQPGTPAYEGRSSTNMPKNKVGDMPSSSESYKGNDSGNAH